MATPKIMSGARAKVYSVRGNEPPELIGVFNNVSYGQALDAQPAFILGRYGAAEIDYTAQEVVNINASGWRVIGHGPHTAPKLPKLDDLISYDYLKFVIVDRATGESVATIDKVRPTGRNETLAARQLTEFGVNYIGILLGDESGSPNFMEDGTASDLPN